MLQTPKNANQDLIVIGYVEQKIVIVKGKERGDYLQKFKRNCEIKSGTTKHRRIKTWRS
jgi:hypothetical protein